ncbi:MAG: AMP-binding protein [Geminicoccaceae bacterium]|nr:AMP-binding protein [Geminicoccaceae bacterium]
MIGADQSSRRPVLRIVLPEVAPLAYDSFPWVGDSLRYWAREAPDRVALSEGGTVFSYRKLEALVEATRQRLAERGVVPGDRVLIVLENSALAVVAILAVCRLRAWAVPLNARLSAREVDAIRAHCAPKLSIYTTGVSAEAGAHARRHEAGDDHLFEALGGQIAAARTSVAEPAGQDPTSQVAALIYTSGTTGAPKGVMLTHDNLGFISGRSSTCRRLSPADRVYAVLPFSHVFGLASVMLGTLYQGGRLDLAPRFVPEEAARALEQDGITVFQGVPQMHARLLALAKARGRPIAAPVLRYTTAGGAPLDLGLKRQIEAMWGIPLHNGYGMTEASPTISTTVIDRPADDHACGHPLPDVEVRIAGPDGSVLPEGEVGEIRVKGRLVMRGYYRDPEQTALTIVDGWLRTGDLGRLVAGDLYVEGRLKEVIIRSGFNVYPAEVETVLTSHPDVAIAAVVGRPVAGNEDIVAFVQPVPGRTLEIDDLSTFVRSRLAPYKRPSVYRILDELPATATGKIIKSALHDLAGALEPHSDRAPTPP